MGWPECEDVTRLLLVVKHVTNHSIYSIHTPEIIKWILKKVRAEKVSQWVGQADMLAVPIPMVRINDFSPPSAGDWISSRSYFGIPQNYWLFVYVLVFVDLVFSNTSSLPSASRQRRMQISCGHLKRYCDEKIKGYKYIQLMDLKFLVWFLICFINAIRLNFL
jgi:hypothetical protein